MDYVTEYPEIVIPCVRILMMMCQVFLLSFVFRVVADLVSQARKAPEEKD